MENDLNFGVKKKLFPYWLNEINPKALQPVTAQVQMNLLLKQTTNNSLLTAACSPFINFVVTQNAKLRKDWIYRFGCQRVPWARSPPLTKLPFHLHRSLSGSIRNQNPHKTLCELNKPINFPSFFPR